MLFPALGNQFGAVNPITPKVGVALSCLWEELLSWRFWSFVQYDPPSNPMIAIIIMICFFSHYNSYRCWRQGAWPQLDMITWLITNWRSVILQMYKLTSLKPTAVLEKESEYQKTTVLLLTRSTRQKFHHLNVSPDTTTHQALLGIAIDRHAQNSKKTFLAKSLSHFLLYTVTCWRQVSSDPGIWFW